MQDADVFSDSHSDDLLHRFQSCSRYGAAAMVNLHTLLGEGVVFQLQRRNVWPLSNVLDIRFKLKGMIALMIVIGRVAKSRSVRNQQFQATGSQQVGMQRCVSFRQGVRR